MFDWDDIEEINALEEIAPAPQPQVAAQIDFPERDPMQNSINGVDRPMADALLIYAQRLDPATLAHVAIRLYDMVRRTDSTWHQRRLADWIDNHPILLDRVPISDKTVQYYNNLANRYQ